LVYSFSMQSSLFAERQKRPPCRLNSSIRSILNLSANIDRQIVIFVRKIHDKMNEKDIQSFSLATLIDVCGRRPGDICYDGCLIASRVNVQDEIDIDLFRYPTRIDAFVILLCSKGSGTFTSNLTRHTLTENSIFVHLPGSIIQAESTEEIALHAVICEEEFIRRINIDIRLLSQLFLHVEKQPCLKLDEKEWTGITRSFEELGAEGTEMPADVYSAEVIRSIIRTLAYKVCRVIGRHIETSGERQISARSRNDEYFSQFMNILGKHYTQERSVGFYAGQLNLTPKYLTTLIRKTSGRTAVEWIDDYVVLEAKNLLKYSTMSIQEIAYYLNFSNQSFFGKYFKSHTGMTPSAYRIGRGGAGRRIRGRTSWSCPPVKKITSP